MILFTLNTCHSSLSHYHSFQSLFLSKNINNMRLLWKHICTFAIIQIVKAYEVGLIAMKLLIKPWVNKTNNKDSTSLDWY